MKREGRAYVEGFRWHQAQAEQDAVLRDSANREELLAFLTNKVAEYNWPENKTVYMTSGFHYDNNFIILFMYRQKKLPLLF